jgi:hypothetical protein
LPSPPPSYDNTPVQDPATQTITLTAASPSEFVNY